MDPSVAVVILNWNGKQWLENFLPSVVASNYSNLQIIVGDNDSTDDSIEFLKIKLAIMWTHRDLNIRNVRI